jgi:tape measure domain-containing protein
VSVVANVAVNLDARNARRQLEDFINSSRRATDQLQNFANRSRQTETAIGGVARAVGKLALAYGTLRTAQAALQAGISRIESERRIQFLARGYGEAARLATAASRAAEKFGVSQTEANQALANTYARLRPVGIELSTIESVYAGFNTAARISGASAVEASNAFTQLAQALGSGALRGDEFNSISEQVPGILTAISKETGVAQGALRKYAADGKITADVVIRALQRIEKEGADQLADALNGPQQKIKDLQNAAEDLQVALTKDVIPELAVNLKELAELIRNLEGPIRFIGGIAANTIGTINDLINLATKPGQTAARASIEGGRLPAFPLKGATEELFQNAITRFGTGLEGIEAEARALAETTGVSYADAFVASMQRQLAAIDAAKKLEQAFAGGEGGLRKPDSIIKQPADSKEAEKLAKELAKSLAAGEKLFTQFSRQAVLTGEVSEIERKRLQIQYDYQDRAEQIAELKNAEQQVNLSIINDEIKRLETRELDLEILREQLEIFEKIAGLDFSKLEGLGEKAFGKRDMPDGFADDLPQLAGNKNAAGKIADGLAPEIKKLQDDLNPIKLATETITQGAFAIGDAFSAAFGDVITGAKSTQEALADAFQAIGKAFISMALEIIAKQITLIILQTIFNALSGMGSGTGIKGTEGLGAKAFSGPGIGSQGFTPGLKLFAEGGFVDRPTNALIGEAGEPEYVIPASKMRGAMNRYAAGARGSSVIPGSGEQAAGGMGGDTANAAPIDVRYTVERINSVDYVTADQFRAGMAQAAQQGATQGERRALRTLQNSAATRGRIGV